MRNNYFLLMAFLSIFLVFSFWLMFHTFSVTGSPSRLLVSTKAWSDFGSHIPLIRSFSHGSNWPPQYPLFPGEPIRYHYLFYSAVGWLEKLGLRLDFALNLPSALGLTALVCIVTILSARLFKNLAVGLLSGVLFVFNSSLSFLDFFSTHPVSSSTLKDVISNTSFPAFGPWNDSLITAFWNLNIYTNQRHLGLSLAVLLLSIYLIYFPQKATRFAGFMIGSLALLNQAGFVIGLIFLFWFFITRPHQRIALFVSSLGTIPWLLIAVSTLNISSNIAWQPGYLVQPPLTFYSLFVFWFYNLGLNLFLIPLGFIFSPKSSRNLILPILALFLAANLFRFSPDMINNHKLFNFVVIVGSMYSANLIVRIAKLKFAGRFISLMLVFLITLGGIIDIFPVINDHYLTIVDSPDNRDVNYFLTLPSDSIILNSIWFYHPASLAGRGIFNGYSYFTWSYGYDQIIREQKTLDIYRATSRHQACQTLLSSGIDYVEINSQPENFVLPNYLMWKENFIPDYVNSGTGFVVYSVSKNCSNL